MPSFIRNITQSWRTAFAQTQRNSNTEANQEANHSTTETHIQAPTEERYGMPYYSMPIYSDIINSFRQRHSLNSNSIVTTGFLTGEYALPQPQNRARDLSVDYARRLASEHASIRAEQALFAAGTSAKTVDFVCYRCGDNISLEKGAKRIRLTTGVIGNNFGVCAECQQSSTHRTLFEYVPAHGDYIQLDLERSRAVSTYDTSIIEHNTKFSPPPEPIILNYTANVIRARPGHGFRCAPGEAKTLPVRPLWMGVELEVEPKIDQKTGTFAERYYAELTWESIKHFAVMKSDGSLRNGGFEIVTVPATLAAHRLMWKPFFAGPARNLHSWTTGRAGIHVHIARNSLTQTELGKLLVFINDPENLPFIELVAGRGSVTYSRMEKKNVSDVRRLDTNSQHYDALGISANTRGQTVELRIFKGNVSEGGFFKNIDFTHAAVSFCKVAGIKQLNGLSFYQWLCKPENRSTYPYLIQWAIRKKILNLPKRGDINYEPE